MEKLKMNKLKIIILTLKEKTRTDNINILINFFKDIYEIEIYYGVYGKNIQISDTDEKHIKKLEYENRIKFYNKNIRLNGEEMIKGQLGAAWSHINIYEKIVSDIHDNNYLILEDDAEFLLNIDKFKEYIKNLPKKFDLIHLGNSDWYPFKFDNLDNKYFNKPIKNYFNRATAYILSKNGAEKLLKYCNNYINIPADDLLLYVSFINNIIDLYSPTEIIFTHNDAKFLSIINNIQ